MTKIIKVSPLLKHLETVDYKELHDFQGDLKTLPDESLEKLKLSLIENGIFVPKIAWKNQDGKLMLIDGNQTKRAFIDLENEGWQIPKVPYYTIPAKDDKEAAAKLLIIDSRFGVINVNTDFVERFALNREQLLIRVDIPELMYQWTNVNREELLKETPDQKEFDENIETKSTCPSCGYRF